MILNAIRLLHEEFPDLEGDDLALAIALRYHPAIAPAKKLGRRNKWTDLICSALAVDVDSRLALGDSPKKIWLDLAETDWARCLTSKEPRNQFLKPYYKGVLNKDDYAFALQMHSNELLWKHFLEKILANF